MFQPKLYYSSSNQNQVFPHDNHYSRNDIWNSPDVPFLVTSGVIQMYLFWWHLDDSRCIFPDVYIQYPDDIWSIPDQSRWSLEYFRCYFNYKCNCVICCFILSSGVLQMSLTVWNGRGAKRVQTRLTENNFKCLIVQKILSKCHTKVVNMIRSYTNTHKFISLI